MKDFFSVKNKNVFLTGGTSGIGKTLVHAFVQQGAQVIFTGRRKSGFDLEKEIGGTFIQCDVSDENAMADALKQAADKLGKLDVLILNAGYPGEEKQLTESSTEDTKKVFDVNLMGVYFGLKHAPQFLKEGASIILTSSTSSTVATNAYGLYAASKAAIVQLAKTSAIELGKQNIRVNLIAPGLIATGMNDEMDEKTIEGLSKLPALGRFGTAEELIGAYLFLASNASTYISGQEIRIDGGLTSGISNFLADKLFE